MSKGIALLKQKGFTLVGQGAFGIVMINPGKPFCAIKFVKDLSRCKELKSEYKLSQHLSKSFTLGFALLGLYFTRKHQ